LASRLQGDRLETVYPSPRSGASAGVKPGSRTASLTIKSSPHSLLDVRSPAVFTRSPAPPLEWRRESFSRSEGSAEKTLPIQASGKASRPEADGRSSFAENSRPADVNRLAEQVYQVIERRVRKEREWRGWR